MDGIFKFKETFKGEVVGIKLITNNFSDKFLLETKEVWQPLYEKELTLEDAREIASNMVEFVNILEEWYSKLV